MRVGRIAPVLVIALLAAACEPANPPTASIASPVGPPSAAASAAADTPTPPAAPTPSPSQSPSEAATPLPTDPGLRLDPAAVLQVCSPFDADGSPAIDCADGLALAYSALGADASRAVRADFGFDCAGCPPRSPSRA